MLNRAEKERILWRVLMRNTAEPRGAGGTGLSSRSTQLPSAPPRQSRLPHTPATPARVSPLAPAAMMRAHRDRQRDRRAPPRAGRALPRAEQNAARTAAPAASSASSRAAYPGAVLTSTHISQAGGSRFISVRTRGSGQILRTEAVDIRQHLADGKATIEVAADRR